MVSLAIYKQVFAIQKTRKVMNPSGPKCLYCDKLLKQAHTYWATSWSRNSRTAREICSITWGLTVEINPYLSYTCCQTKFRHKITLFSMIHDLSIYCNKRQKKNRTNLGHQTRYLAVKLSLFSYKVRAERIPTKLVDPLISKEGFFTGFQAPPTKYLSK